MKIKRLEIRGFKSFLDKTVIEFPEGISAVVGPNGCGKSNIVDAIRWALGEQSPSRLRGKQMEDVIFAGSNAQKPFGMAEVSLVMSNDNGYMPSAYRQFSEVMVTRRLFRSGESEYLINKTPCRLKDIQEVFWDTGLGSRSYSVIEQGKVSAIVDMRPEERRSLIEEAAGISKYKNRKKEALHKMEQAQQNLVRVSDIVNEVGRQLAALKRQAAKAKRYGELKERLRLLDLSRTFSDYRALDLTQRSLEERYESAAKEEDDRQTLQNTLQAKLDALKIEFDEREETIKERDKRLYALKYRIQELENESQRRKQRLAELKKREEEDRNDLATIKSHRFQLEDGIRKREAEFSELSENLELQCEEVRRLNKELEDKAGDAARFIEKLEDEKKELLRLAGRRSDLQNKIVRIEDLRKELERRRSIAEEDRETLTYEKEEIETELSRTLERLTDLEDERIRIEGELADERTRLSNLKQELAEKEKELQQGEREQHGLKSRLQTLKELWEKLEYFDTGTKAFVEHSRRPDTDLKGIAGLLADRIEVPMEYETALETALGPTLQAVLVESFDLGVENVLTARNRFKGSIRLLPVRSREGMNECDADNKEGASLPLLHRMVRLPDSFNGLSRRLLEDICVTPDLETAGDLHRRTGLPVVTLTGEMIGREGMIVAGNDKRGGSGILSKKREMEKIEALVSDQADKLSSLSETVNVLRGEVLESKQRHEGIREDLDALKSRCLEMEQKVFRYQEKKKTLSRQIETAEEEFLRIDDELVELESKLSETMAEKEEVTTEKSVQETRVADLTEKFETVRADTEALKERLYKNRLEAQSTEAKRTHLETEIGRTRQLIEDTDNRVEKLQNRLEEYRDERERLFTLDKQAEKEVSSVFGQIGEIERSLNELHEVQDESQSLLSRLKKEILEIGERGHSAREALSALKVTLAENRVTIEHLLEDAYRRHGVRLDEGYNFELEEVDPEEAAAEIDRLTARISAMGEINPAAISEYQALLERSEFLNQQRDDLVTSIEDLHRTIRRMNQVCRQKFTETLDKINDNLKQVFPALFGGGRAELSLTDPSEVLESGIEIHVQPPGKKLTLMGLMSGGEKALTALALLFAMYLIKPSPFYLMDEIDAPLDEANVDRFNRLLKKMAVDSQVILITHSRRTMELVDQLFGVTMERPGVSRLVSVNLREVEAA